MRITMGSQGSPRCGCCNDLAGSMLCMSITRSIIYGLLRLSECISWAITAPEAYIMPGGSFKVRSKQTRRKHKQKRKKKRFAVNSECIHLRFGAYEVGLRCWNAHSPTALSNFNGIFRSHCNIFEGQKLFTLLIYLDLKPEMLQFSCLKKYLGQYSSTYY